MKNKMKAMGITNPSSKSLLANVLDMDDDLRHADDHISRVSSQRNPQVDTEASVNRHPQFCFFPESELKDILKEVRFISQNMKKTNEHMNTTSDWQFAAMVIDRICLILCSSFTIIATIIVVITAPHFLWD